MTNPLVADNWSSDLPAKGGLVPSQDADGTYDCWYKDKQEGNNQPAFLELECRPIGGIDQITDSPPGEEDHRQG